MKINQKIKNAIFLVFFSIIFGACGSSEKATQIEDSSKDVIEEKEESIESETKTSSISDSLEIAEESGGFEEEVAADSVAPALASPPKIPERNKNIPAELATKKEVNYNGTMITLDSVRLFKIEVYLEEISEDKYRGFYRYEGKTAKIFIEGKTNKTGVINLVERINGKETGMFRLTKIETGGFRGDWRSPDGSKNLRVLFQKN